MTTTRNKQLIILLHGVGASGASIAPLANGLKSALPNAIFAAPNAPHASDFGQGYQWFSVSGVTEQNRAQRIFSARQDFDRCISTLIAENGFENALHAVGFVGFSQGTIMALDGVASGRWPIGAVAGFSGRLASPQPLQPATQTPVLLIHGSADPVIDHSESAKAAATLKEHGLSVELITEPGLGHSISPQGAEHAAQFLAKALG